mgnify:CR=1 FL=1
MSENLEKYVKDYEKVLKSREFKSLYAQIYSNKEQTMVRLKKDFVPLLRTKGHMTDEYNNLSRKEKKIPASKLPREIINFYAEFAPAQPAKATATASINLLNVFLKKNPIKTLLSSSIVKYNGEKISASELASPDFRPSNIVVRKPKELEIAEIKQVIGDFLKNPDVKVNLLDINTYVEPNFKKLITELTESAKDNKILIEDVNIIGDFDMNLKSIFNDRTLKDFDEREKTYKYWKKIYKQIASVDEEGKETGLIPTLKELSVELKKTKSEEKDIVELIKFLEGDISDLNYVGKFEYVNVGVKDLDVLAYELFSQYLTLMGGLMENQKTRSPTEAIRGFTRDAARNVVASGDQREDEDYDESTGERLEDIANDKVKEFKDDMEQMPMDPLSVLYLNEVLKGVGLVTGDIRVLKQKIQKYFYDLYEDNDKPKLEEDDAYAFFGDFLKRLDKVESTPIDNIYLPLAFAEKETLKTHYSNMRDKLIRSDDTIRDFFRLFKKFIELNPITFDSNISLDMKGAGTGGKRLPDKQQGRWFNYSNYVAGKSGSLRTSFSDSKEKEADSLNENINKLINEISEILAEVYIAPQFTRHRVGVSLDFEGDATLRTVVAYKVSSPKFDTVKQINKRLIESKFFLESEDIEDIIDFLERLSGAKAINQYNELYASAEKFTEVLEDAFGNKETINQQINQDVASILGSVYRYVSPEYKAKYEGIDDFNGISVEAAFDKRKKNDPLDMYPVQAFTELLRTRGKNIPFRTESGEKESFYGAKDNKGVSRMLSLMDSLVKSVFQQKQLEAHDAIRILKSKPIHYSLKKINDFDHVNDMIEKMETEHRIDMSASEIISIVNKIDSYEGIADDYGISPEHVYILKANFR